MGEEDDDYPLAEQEYDRRLLEEMDRERAAGREVLIPGAVADAVIEGLHPIRAWREYRVVSQRDLAATTGIDLAKIEAIENGRLRASPRETETLARALECTPGHFDLLDEDDQPSP